MRDSRGIPTLQYLHGGKVQGGLVVVLLFDAGGVTARVEWMGIGQCVVCLLG